MGILSRGSGHRGLRQLPAEGEGKKILCFFEEGGGETYDLKVPKGREHRMQSYRPPGMREKSLLRGLSFEGILHKLRREIALLNVTGKNLGEQRDEGRLFGAKRLEKRGITKRKYWRNLGNPYGGGGRGGEGSSIRKDPGKKREPPDP